MLAFTFCLTVTLAIWQLAVTEAAKLRQARFDSRVQTVQEAIQTRMLAYGQILLGGVGLVKTMGSVSRDQWASYVASLSVQKNYPGVHGIGFAEWVPHASRGEFVRRMAAQGLPNFQIRPAGDRETYAPVTFLEPRTDRNLRALGFDMLSEPTRQAAMVTAADSAQMAITGRLKLASEPNQSPVFGFLVYVPVYKPHKPIGTVDERHQALKGFVNSPFRMDDLMAGVLGANEEHLQLRVYDSHKPDPDTLLYSSQRPQAFGESDKSLTLTSPLKLHNRTWTVEFSMPSSAYTAGNSTPTLVLVAGTLISLLVGALVLSIAARVRMIRHSEQHYFQLANFDLLTGLPNRVKFHERLSHTLVQAQRTHSRFALIYLDLDNFKAVNDRHGHEAGDLLLIEVAQRIQRCIRKADTVARLGGDEFVVILHEIKDQQDAGTAAQNLLDALAKPVALPGSTYEVSVSMGISIYPSDAQTSDELLKRADRAMYASKSLGRNRYHFFTTELLTLSFDSSPAPLMPAS